MHEYDYFNKGARISYAGMDEHVPFVCRVCHLPGMGPRSADTHPGACRETRRAEVAAKNAAKRAARDAAKRQKGASC